MGSKLGLLPAMSAGQRGAALRVRFPLTKDAASLTGGPLRVFGGRLVDAVVRLPGV